MNFLLKEGKTNWKYILIVVILVIIVSGGILGYTQYFRKEIISLSKFPEMKKPEKIVKDETANWETYRNEKIGIEFQYPKEKFRYFEEEYREYSGEDPYFSGKAISVSFRNGDKIQGYHMEFRAHSSDFNELYRDRFVGSEDIISLCPGGKWSSDGCSCKIIKGPSEIPIIFQSCFGGDPAFMGYSFDTKFFFNNQNNKSIYRGLEFIIDLDDAQKLECPTLPKPETLEYAEWKEWEKCMHAQARKIIDEDLTKRDAEELETYKKILNTLRFIEQF